MRLSDLGITGDEYDDIHSALVAEGWMPIGEGHFAVVYGHANFPEVAIRQASSADAFVSYAWASLTHLRDFVGIHVPLVYDMVIQDDDSCVCLVERLVPFEETEDPDDQLLSLRGARMLLAGVCLDDLSLDMLDAVIEAYPRLPEFVERYWVAMGSRITDSRLDNLMLRGGNLIVNDPQGSVLTEREVEGFRRCGPWPGWSESDLSALPPQHPVVAPTAGCSR